MKTKDREVMFSSKSDEWGTPRLLFQKLHDEFNFCVDVCATEENALLDSYVSDALNEDWAEKCKKTHSASRWFTHSFFMNPPYSKAEEMMARMSELFRYHPNHKFVALLPARTDTRWFHNYVLPYYSEIRFIKGRVPFVGGIFVAPFPSMIVVYNSQPVGETVTSWSYK